MISCCCAIILRGCCCFTRGWPLVQVFGRHPQQGDYTPCHGWYNTPDQLVEMMTFDVTGFQQCIDTVLSPDGA